MSRGAETDKIIDIYARVSEVKRKRESEPSTEGQVAMCRVRLADRAYESWTASEYDLTTPNGKKAFRDAINAAACYSDRLPTRVSRGKKLKAMSGRPNGTVRPFGFEPDLMTVREDEAAVRRELTARILAGETVDALLADLNARGTLIRLSRCPPHVVEDARFRLPPYAQVLPSAEACPRRGGRSARYRILAEPRHADWMSTHVR